MPAHVWARTQLFYVCSPGNPTGAVLTLDNWRELFALSDEHGFVIASDECYSEIYFDEAQPPLGGLEVARLLGARLRASRHAVEPVQALERAGHAFGFRRGRRVDPQGLSAHHGAALSTVFQRASVVAWQDEAHVRENRAKYVQKFETVTPMLAEVLDMRLPDAAFYLWANVSRTGLSDTEFAAHLYADYNVTVLPGSYLALARDAQGTNPGKGFIRIALVAETQECVGMCRRRPPHRRILPLALVLSGPRNLPRKSIHPPISN